MPAATMENTEFLALYERAKAGDLTSRQILTSEERWAVACAGAAALPVGADAFRREMDNLAAEGCPADLLVDILIQMAAYLGYPRARQCLEQLGSTDLFTGQPSSADMSDAPAASDEERFARGSAAYGQLNSEALNTIRKAFGGVAPDIVDLTFRSFGDVFARSKLALEIRQLATVTALGVMANAAPQLRFHVGVALNVGVQREKIVECVYWIQFMAGMPAAYNALIEVKAAMADGAGAQPAYN